MKDFEDKTVKVISKLICDRCGEEAIPEDNTFHEFISINHHCGYGSIHGDGNEISIDLCQQCFSGMCGDSLRIIDPNDEEHDCDSSIAVKDILLAKKIINKDELAVALRRLDKLWDAQHLSEAGSELNQLADLICDFEGKSWDKYFNEEDSVSSDLMSEREDLFDEKGSANGILSGIKVNKSVSDDESLQSDIDEEVSITQVLPKEQIKLLETLSRVWTQYPDLRLTQLIVNAINPQSLFSDVFYVEDSEVIDKLKKLLDKST